MLLLNAAGTGPTNIPLTHSLLVAHVQKRTTGFHCRLLTALHSLHKADLFTNASRSTFSNVSGILIIKSCRSYLQAHAFKMFTDLTARVLLCYRHSPSKFIFLINQKLNPLSSSKSDFTWKTTQHSVQLTFLSCVTQF